MSATTTAFAWSSANLLASARPMPRAAPVTTTTLPVTSIAGSFQGLIVAGKKFLWKTPAGSFRRFAIAHRITPHGRRGPRLQRCLSARNRADREALDRGRRQGSHPRARSLQSIALGHPRDQRSRFDGAPSRARDRRHRGKARRPGTARASELSTDVARARARAGAGFRFGMGRELAFD